MTDILKWIGDESGINDDLLRSTDKGTAQKILSIAWYWTANPGSTLPPMEEWQINHDVPYSYGVSMDAIYDLMEQVGYDESIRQKFFTYRASRSPSGSAIAYDSTTVSSYSENQIEVRYGLSKDGRSEKIVKLLTQYNLETGQPVAYSRQPGNIADMKSLVNAAKQLSVLGMEKPMLVMDGGYYSEENMGYLIHNHIKFLVRGRLNVAWVKEQMDQVFPTLDQLTNNCPFDTGVYGITVTIKHAFQRTIQKDHGKSSKGDVVSEEHRLYLHLFLDKPKHEIEKSDLAYDIRRIQAQLEAGVEIINADEQRLMDKYLIIKNTKKGKSIQYNDAAFMKDTAYAGCMVLISNAPMNTFNALHHYSKREKIEEYFRTDKQSFDANLTRVWKPESLNGRFFCQFVSICYTEFFKKRLKDLKEELAVPNGDPVHDSAENMKAEKQLLNWLNKMSIKRLFDWFDCIEKVEVDNGFGKKRWTTETTARDRLFLRKMGIIKDQDI